MLNILNRGSWEQPQGTWRDDIYIGVHLSDMFRQMIVHEYGGIYVDLDSISVQVCNQGA